MAGQTTKGIGKLTSFEHAVRRACQKFRRRDQQEGINSLRTTPRERAEWEPELWLSQFCPWRSTCVRDLSVGWLASQT